MGTLSLGWLQPSWCGQGAVPSLCWGLLPIAGTSTAPTVGRSWVTACP